MITYNNKEFRNLEEQVGKNQYDIARHFEITKVLADFGIQVLGQVDTPDALTNIDEGENWGYAYLVGAAEPYDVYVWTRPNEALGHPTPYFLNIGPVSITGPQGPAGNSIVSAKTISTTASFFTPAQTLLQLNLSDGTTITVPGNIRGAQGVKGDRGPTGSQGIQGPKGDTGETGPQGIQGIQGRPGSIRIEGLVATTDLLPSAATLDNATAYLVGTSTPYDVYVVISNNGQLQWQNLGPAAVGTVVSVGGQPVSDFDADTKLDKYIRVLSNETGRVYGMNNKSETTNYLLNSNSQAYTIAFRNSRGTFSVGEPTSNDNPATKSYVDNALAASVSDHWKIYEYSLDENVSPFTEQIEASPTRIMSFAISYKNNSPTSDGGFAYVTIPSSVISRQSQYTFNLSSHTVSLVMSNSLYLNIESLTIDGSLPTPDDELYMTIVYK